MSLVLNMIGGGGSFTATDAILRVQAPATSVVIISKGTTVKTDYGHENMLDPTVYDYYFIIHQSQFDSLTPWSVAATNGAITNIQTIIINASNEYNLRFLCHMPDEYQEVEYIQATGTQRIEVLDSAVTQYSASSSYIMTLKCTLSDIANLRHVFGTIGGSARLSVLNVSSSRQSFFYTPDDQIITSGVTANTIYTYVISTINGTATFVRNGTTVASHSINTFPSFNQFIYTIKSDESSQYNGKGNIYYFKYEIDGVINNELFPCYRKSDSVAGMYDRVKNHFVPNQGTGNFTVGRNVNP